jgi:type IV pilus assembly protein PilV
MEKSNENGFTLIEVLISVLVLAVGVIGAARLQMGALQTSQQSAYQTAALQLAAELADKMRVHGNMSGPAGNPYLALDYTSADTALGKPVRTCYASSCDAEEAAIFDIHELKSRIKSVLPGGRIKICRDNRPWDSSAGALTWACTAPPEGGEAAIVIKIGWLGKGARPDGSKQKGAASDFPPGVAMAVKPYAE